MYIARLGKDDLKPSVYRLITHVCIVGMLICGVVREFRTKDQKAALEASADKRQAVLMKELTEAQTQVREAHARTNETLHQYTTAILDI